MSHRNDHRPTDEPTEPPADRGGDPTAATLAPDSTAAPPATDTDRSTAITGSRETIWTGYFPTRRKRRIQT